jgi:hypothetical protein
MAVVVGGLGFVGVEVLVGGGGGGGGGVVVGVVGTVCGGC